MRNRDLNWKPFALIAAGTFFVQGCGSNLTEFVTVYTSQDQVYAEPILSGFTQETGIETRVVYDSEAVKTVGLANRLIAEQDNPQCDIFWNNEEFRTRQLAAMGVFKSANAWSAFGYRTRRIVINTNLVSISDAPRTLLELTNEVWRGKIALAYPLFGTTATHFLALRAAWGPSQWESWCRGLRAGEPLLVDGNSVVVRLVGRGEASLGLTDSDDIAAGKREGLPITELPLQPASMAIRNTVGIIRNAPHPNSAQALFDYLQGPKVLSALVRAGALEGIDPIQHSTLQPDWNRILLDLETTTSTLKEIFLR